ncbi:MAG: hypothetical protein LBQ33_06760, partial [Oscillospiraceae bacterium]|nr:hypothetical protein [Oscillospiraceae bacterium]
MKKPPKSPVRRGYADIRARAPAVLPLTALSNVLAAVTPFINIVFPAKIIDVLFTSKDVKTLAALALSAVLLNYALSLLQAAVRARLVMHDEHLWIGEKNSVTEKMLRMDFAALEQAAFRSKVEQHRDEGANEGGVFMQLLWVTRIAVRSFTSILSAAILMRHFWAVMFTRTGESFVEGPWLSAIFAGSALMVGGVMGFITGKINQKSVKMRKQYADINRVFSFYRDMITDYKTGKEIRIFKEQPFILRHATAELVTRGVKLQEKISSYYAMNNGLATMLFSVVAFALYLMIGLKARAGLYSIGDMV